jgi:hypothetical protein
VLASTGGSGWCITKMRRELYRNLFSYSCSCLVHSASLCYISRISTDKCWAQHPLFAVLEFCESNCSLLEVRTLYEDQIDAETIGDGVVSFRDHCHAGRYLIFKMSRSVLLRIGFCVIIQSQESSILRRHQLHIESTLITSIAHLQMLNLRFKS